jgi:glycosyltransferase involved in cell wall biosynthesis
VSARQRVALVVIARDEAPRIGRLLRSVASWVDSMLVLDTGSTDDTPVVAAGCGARVAHAAWTDDFSAARNRALDLAGADWHLVLDADEWLISGGAALRALGTEVPAHVGAVQFRDRCEAGGTQVAQTWMSRVFPGALRYAGRVHEQVAHGLPLRRLDVVIGHDGYLPERVRAKRGRNRALLEAELADRPHDAYLWYQLGKDCDVYREHALAEAAFARAETLGGAAHAWWCADCSV